MSEWDYRCAVGLSLYSIRGVERKINHYNDNEDDTDTKDSSEIWHVSFLIVLILLLLSVNNRYPEALHPRGLAEGAPLHYYYDSSYS